MQLFRIRLEEGTSMQDHLQAIFEKFMALKMKWQCQLYWQVSMSQS
jgi:hypothetical protein